MIELYGVVDRGLIIKRHAQQQTLRARLLSESRLAHSLTWIQTRATDEHRHSLPNSSHRRFDELLVLFPKERVKFAKAAGGRDHVGAAVPDNLIHGARQLTRINRIFRI